jgi:hypothetical protein
MPLECPEDCEFGVTFDEFVRGGEIYRRYQIYCAAATLASTLEEEEA